VTVIGVAEINQKRGNVRGDGLSLDGEERRTDSASYIEAKN